MSVALRFVAPPPGLAPHVDFGLDAVDEGSGLFALRALDEPALRLYAVDPRRVVDDYAPELGDDQVSALGLTSADDALLLVVARPSDDGVSVNLLAPIVINTRSGAAAQVILEDQDHPVRALLG